MYPAWALDDNESDEFSHWMSGTGDPGFRAFRSFSRAPRQHRQLIDWLQQAPSEEFLHGDDWGDLCKESFRLAARALRSLAIAGVWPVDRWRTALQTWSNDPSLFISFRILAPYLGAMPDSELLEISASATWWLEAWAKTNKQDVPIFYALCDRFLALKYPDQSGKGSQLTDALNHAIGRVTQALLEQWFKRSPTDDQGLPSDFSGRFEKICRGTGFRAGRVLLAAHVIALFRVDPPWTRLHLLPCFYWDKDSAEAKECWDGFLWGPRLYAPLFSELKQEFLTTAEHYDELDVSAQLTASLARPLDCDGSWGFGLDVIDQELGSLMVQGRRAW